MKYFESVEQRRSGCRRRVGEMRDRRTTEHALFYYVITVPDTL